MSDQRIAVWIDGRNWTDEIVHVRSGASATIKRPPAGESGQIVAGRTTEYLELTLRDNDETRLLVGSIPQDGHAEVLVVLADPTTGTTSSLTVLRMEATTLDATDLGPAFDSSVDVDGVACFVSAWFAQNVTHTQLRLTHR